MMPASSLLASLVCVVTLLVAPHVSAEEIVLRARYRPGDVYRLALNVSTTTEGTSKGLAGESVDENVRLRYRASVVVLEVDGDGRPVRERHARVSLTFDRPGESGSLFKEGVAYEVLRKDGIEVLLGNQRVEPTLEKTLAEILEKQFEYTLEPALLEPGRAVDVGDSWQPDPSLARRFLLSRGIRVLEFGDGASATLRRKRDEEGRNGLVIDYRIPIARFELTRMPPHTAASRSEARLEGQIRLASEPRTAPTSVTSNLTLSMSGISTGTAQSVPWSVRSSTIVEKSSTLAQDLVRQDAGSSMP